MLIFFAISIFFHIFAQVIDNNRNMFFNFFKKKKNKSKHRCKFTSSSYKKCSLGPAQIQAITDAVISKKRLFVFSESM